MNGEAGSDRRLRVIARLAGIAAALVLVITSMSALIRLTNAGLGCADWPACYTRAAAAQISPALREDSASIAAARIAHRVSAVAALILILVLAYACLGAKPIRWPEGLASLVLLGLAIFLAILGRWTTGSRLPAITLGNLLGGFAMVAILWWVRQRALAPHRVRSPQFDALRGWGWLGALLLVAQIALGGLVSAKFAALACTGLPGCGEAALTTGWEASAFDPWREPSGAPGDPRGAALHMAHRLAGALSAALLGAVAAAAFMRRPAARRAAAVLASLLLAQIALGMMAVAFGLPLAVVVAHNLVAALMLPAWIGLDATLRSG